MGVSLLPSRFSQPLHITYRWCTKEPLVLPVEVRGIIIPHTVGSTSSVKVLPQHQTASLQGVTIGSKDC
ncbi:hypothetical protein Mic7113_2026 [Allocoleopsis franciscana PCC 7113]|uniref:Uncharacterized protein n=1 Tax=Allocoleopsis franciscana PCC 7113 TaxID=1173027 RepID=K9WEA5_9CYAN|nr:hypothetical protein Mic7113_2026 [Allocoleopsis franciscana PCC 7113]